MKVVKVLNVAEAELDRVEKEIVVLKTKFDLDSPMHAMLNESLTKLLQAKRLNRMDQQKPQDKYRYVVESLHAWEPPVAEYKESVQWVGAVYDPTRRDYVSSDNVKKRDS